MGQSLRVVVVDLMPDDKHQPYSMINPEIVAASEELATREEGCLSLPANSPTLPGRPESRFATWT